MISNIKHFQIVSVNFFFIPDSVEIIQRKLVENFFVFTILREILLINKLKYF